MEAREQGLWRGGNEENFVKLVKELEHGEVEEEAGEGLGNEGDVGEVVNEEASDNTQNVLIHQLSWQQLQQTLLQNNLLPPPISRSRTARGFSGLPFSETPALEGALRGTIHCPDTDPRMEEVLSSMLAFWNEPRGMRDDVAGHARFDNNNKNSNPSSKQVYNETHPHPFLPKPLPPLSSNNSSQNLRNRRYLTFEPDTGGWNNLRMSLENLIVLAAVSGRTLVLPPDQIMYLLESRAGDPRRGRSYADFFNLTENTELLRRVPIITSKKFLAIEGKEGGLIPIVNYNETFQSHLWSITEECEERKKSDVYCEDLYDHYRQYGKLASVSAEPPYENCFIFDIDVFTHGEEYIPHLSEEIQNRIRNFCKDRVPVFYSREMHDAPVWHFETMDFRYRLLIHYYAFILFTDPLVSEL